MKWLRCALAVLVASLCCGQSSNINNPGSSAPAGTGNLPPTVVTVGAVNAIGSGTTFTIGPPASIVNGNPLVAFLAVAGQNAETWTPAAGFIQIGSTLGNANGAKVTLGVFCKIASSESGNYTFTFNNAASGVGVGVILQLSGTTCTTDAINTATANAATLSVPSFSTTNTNDLIISFGSHTSGNPVLDVSSPAITTNQVQNNGVGINTMPLGATTVPAFNLVSYATNSGTGGSTNAISGMVIAFPGNTTSTAPYVVNSSSVPHASGGIAVTGNASISGTLFANAVVIPTCTLSTTYPLLGLYFQRGTGYPEQTLCMTAGNNLALDGSGNLTFISTWAGNKGGPKLLLGNNLMFVSQDISQDLVGIVSDSSNNLRFGCSPAADCTGATEQNNVYLSAQTGKLISERINDVDRLTVGDTKNLLTAGSGNPTTILSIPVATGQSAEGIVHFFIHGDDGTPAHVASISGQVSYACENTAAVFKCGVDTAAGDNVLKELTGADTLTLSFAASGANPTVISVTPTASASYTTWTITYNIDHGGQTVPTF